MKILVTGATGFVGSHLIQKLTKYEYKIVVRTLDKNFVHNQQIIYDINNLEKFKKDIKDFNPNIVIHLASYLTSLDDVKSIINIVDSNILFTSILLESLKETDLNLFINTGTFAQYYFNDGVENPAYFYAASKSAINPIIRYFKCLLNFKSINVIPYTIYGKKSKSKKVIDFLIDSIDSKVAIDMTNGEQILDFIYIDDVVDFFVYCIENKELLDDNADYHLGTGIGTSIKQLSTFIEMQIGKPLNINWGARNYRTLDIMRAIAPIYKLEKELHWKPKVSIEDGIKKILNRDN